MMVRIAKGPRALLSGESFVALSPEPAERVDADWRRRSHLFEGRAVSDRALSADQRERGGRMATLPQRGTPGILLGLEAALEWDAEQTPARAILHVQPGVGLGHSGEDLRLPRPLAVPLADLGVGTGSATFGDLFPDPTAVPRAAFIVVLEPVEIPRLLHYDERDPCEQDPESYSFQQRAFEDGVRVRLEPWPEDDLGPVPGGPRMQNRLAHRILRREARRAPGMVLGWEALALPIAVLGFTGSSTAAPFLDVHAVARTGGLIDRRLPIRSRAGSPGLWQARFEQFVDQLARTDLDVLRGGGLSERFRFLPPIGTLPAGSVQLRTDMGTADGELEPIEGLFPESYAIEGVVVQLEALDDLMRSSAGLEPFDLNRRDQLQIVVPVPQELFDPGLLHEELIDGIFDRTLRLFQWRLRDSWNRDDSVRSVLAHLEQRLYREELEDTQLEQPDDATPDGEDLAAEPERDPETYDSAFITQLDSELRDMVTAWAAVVGESAMATLLEALKAEEVTLPTTPIARRAVDSDFGGLGLAGFLQQLSSLAERMDEKLDLVFTKTRTALYRIRHVIAGEAEVTRAATSPVLNELAKSNYRAVDGRRWREFTDVFQSQAVAAGGAGAASGEGGEEEGSGGGGGGGAGAPVLMRMMGARAGSTAMREELASMAVGAGAATGMVAAEVAAGAFDRSDAADAAERGALGHFIEASELGIEREVMVDRDERLRAIIDDFAYRPSTSFWFERSPTVRLDPPPAIERKAFALEVKVEAFRTLVEIHDAGLDLTGLRFPGFVDGGDETRTIEQVRAALDSLGGDGESPFDDSDDGDDEAAIFNTGVRGLEHTVASLRMVEQRISRYRRIHSAGKKRFASMEQERGRVQSRLRELGDELAERRHDVAVAEALIDEENARLDAVNARRREVIREHVPFLVFRRPRTVEARAAVPRHAVEPGLRPDPIPQCLSSDFEAPDQLRAMVDLLREAPIKWLAIEPQLLESINRVETLHTLVRHSLTQARLTMPEVHSPFALPVITQHALGRHIGRAFTAQLESVKRVRTLRASIDPARVLQASFQGARKEARKVLTLDDFISGRHGRQDARKLATQELENVYRIAACLYTRFQQVPASLRLRWAERISEHDEPVELRQLVSLPGFGQVDRLDRHEMQALADWLYQRVDPQEPEAIALIHELVRVALLLASHAPVSRIIEANVVEGEPPVARGGFVRVKLDPTSVRIGMHATLLDASRGVLGRGIVHDLSAGLAQVRVMTATAQTIAPVKVEIAEPARSGQLQTAAGVSVSFGVAGLLRR